VGGKIALLETYDSSGNIGLLAKYFASNPILPVILFCQFSYFASNPILPVILFCQ
jgi:hypothetical protein